MIKNQLECPPDSQTNGCVFYRMQTGNSTISNYMLAPHSLATSILWGMFLPIKAIEKMAPTFLNSNEFLSDPIGFNFTHYFYSLPLIC